MKPGNRATQAADQEAVINDLRQELAARIAEADWLKGRYEAELRAAFASRPAAARPAAPVRTEPAPDRGSDTGTIGRLQSELDRALAAELRYLDRIEELKDQVTRLTRGGAGS